MTGKLTTGGAERVISVLSNELTKKYDVTVLTISEAQIDYDISSDVSVIDISQKTQSRFTLVKFFKKVMSIRKFIKSQDFKTVISFLGYVNVLTLFACLGLKVRTVACERNYTSKIGLLKKYLYPKASCLSFQTNEIATVFMDEINNDFKVISNPLSENLPTRDGVDDKIVTISRLSKQKNIDVLIDAFKKVNAKHKGLKLEIYGDGPLRDELLQKYHKLVSEGMVSFRGFQSDALNQIRNAKLFVLSSSYEGMPNALMESMAIGVPSVATDSLGGGVALLTNKGEFATLCYPNNIDALEVEINKALENYDNSLNVAANAKQHVIKNYSINKITKDWIDLIEG